MNPDKWQQQLKEMQQQVELMRTLATRSGFFKYYFKELGKKENGKPVHNTNVECFNHVNETYFQLFREEKYSNYNSFRRSYDHYLKSR